MSPAVELLRAISTVYAARGEAVEVEAGWLYVNRDWVARVHDGRIQVRGADYLSARSLTPTGKPEQVAAIVALIDARIAVRDAAQAAYEATASVALCAHCGLREVATTGAACACCAATSVAA
jgi:hypothetical protein